MKAFIKNVKIGKSQKNLGIWEISQTPMHLRNFWVTYEIYHPQIPIEIWEIWGIPQKLRILGNSQNSLANFRVVYFSIIGSFSNTKLFGKFPKFPDSWGISQVTSYWGNFENLKNIPPSNSHRNSGNMKNSSKSEILRNFQNTWESWEFSKYL